jgi:serine/threonine protein kinase
MQERQYYEALPIGYRLTGYRIEAVLGQGGFGITYRAQDAMGARQHAIKEYFPATSAVRLHDLRVAPRSSAFHEEFEYGLQRFRNEAETLARFNHSNIVRVWHLLDLNETAYIVMDFEEGATLAGLLMCYPGGIPEPGIVALFRGIVDGLETVHKSGHLHRDLAPDNIIVRRDDTPVIVDFGAARFAYGQKSRSLEAIIKSGYSPPEQYMLEYSRQGVWTDLYALGAIAYRCIGGPTPPPSLDRQGAAAMGQPDPLVPPATFANASPRSAKREPAKPPVQSSSGFLRRLFGLGRDGPSGSGVRHWILTGTDSTGGFVRIEFSEDMLRKSHGKLLIGRDEAQSNVTIADQTVSRCHALVSLDERGLVIEDAHSSNGTWVNGAQLTPSLRSVPVDGATRITLGGVNLVVSVGRSGRGSAKP